MLTMHCMFLQTTDMLKLFFMLQLNISLGCDCATLMVLLDLGSKPLGCRGAMNLNVILNLTLR